MKDTSRFSAFAQAMREGKSTITWGDGVTMTIASTVLGESIICCSDDVVAQAEANEKGLCVYRESEINRMLIHRSPTPAQWRVAHDAKKVFKGATVMSLEKGEGD